MPLTTRSQHPYGSNQSDLPVYHGSCDADELIEYLHDVDVCAEEDFWLDEEDRHEL